MGGRERERASEGSRRLSCGVHPSSKTMAAPPNDDKAGEDAGSGGGSTRPGVEDLEVQLVREKGGGGAVHSGVAEGAEVLVTGEIGGGGGHSGVAEEAEVLMTGEIGGGGGQSELEGEEAEEAEDANGIEEEDDEKALLELKALCNVLGSNYKEKLDEIGIVNGVDITSTIRNRLLQAVSFLKITKKNRFEKIKEYAEKLQNKWTKSEEPTARLLNVYQSLYVLRADSPDDIYEEKYLSTALLRKIEKEISIINTSMKGKYQRKKKKLLHLLKELHLTTTDVDFDPKENIDLADYPQKIEELSGLIMKLKKDRLLRMHVVFRVELIEKGMKERLSVEKLKDLIENAKEYIESRQDEGEICYYNGQNVLEVINALEETITSNEDDNSETNTNKSSRSVRWEARSRRKAMDSSVNTVQEAVTFNFPRRCRSGMERSSNQSDKAS